MMLTVTQQSLQHFVVKNILSRLLSTIKIQIHVYLLHSLVSQQENGLNWYCFCIRLKK